MKKESIVLVFTIFICLNVAFCNITTEDNILNQTSSSTEGSSGSGEGAGTGPNKVKVTVFYEVLCPDSISFVVRQLWPTYSSIGSILNVELIPYGKASYRQQRDSWSFECQHGPNECQGNKIHACAVHLYPNVSRHLPFVQCSLSSSNPVTGSEKCATSKGLDWSQISKCADGTLGSDLLHTNGLRTEALNPKMVFVPWILIDNVFSNEQEEQSLTNFLSVACNAFKGEKPLECVG